MIDIHNHILPGLDDGSKDIEQSLAMAEIAVKDGITTIVATPHIITGLYENSREDILQAVENLNRILQKKTYP